MNAGNNSCFTFENKITTFFLLSTSFWFIIWLFLTITIFSFAKNVSLVGFILAQSVTLFAWFPGVLIYLSYFYKDHNRVVVVSKGKILIQNGGKTITILAEDVDEVVQINCSASGKCPWNNFYYFILALKSGERIKLSFLMDNDKKLSEALRHKCKCKVSFQTSLIPVAW
jgi:hypothetical protein